MTYVPPRNSTGPAAPSSRPRTNPTPFKEPDMATTVPSPATRHTGPRTEIVAVTPMLAKKWLATNSRNRNLRQRAVADYARDMAAGAWTFNGEAIKFSVTGRLLDGQHRLAAVAESGTTVQMLLIWDLPDEAQETMDTGRKRLPADMFSLRGETNAAIVASVLRRIWLWEIGDYRCTGNIAPTVSECADLLAKHPDEIRRAVEIAARVRKQFKQMPQSAVGLTHYLFNRLDPETAPWFFARLGDGADLHLGHPVLTLRTRVINDRADHMRIPDYQYVAYLIRAWNAVRDCRDLDRIIQPADAPMPMPK